MSLELAEASARRQAAVAAPSTDIIEANLRTLLAHYQTVTADAGKMGHLSPLVAHYAKDPHPWQSCFKDNFKRFGPKTPAVCGVLKDIIRQKTDWRGHNNPNDHGSPGVAIGIADRAMTHKLSLSDDGAPVIDDATVALIEDILSQCDPCKVMMGLEDAPHPSKSYLEAIS